MNAHRIRMSQRLAVLSFVAFLAFLSPAFAYEQTARQVAERFDRVLRKSHTSLATKFTLSTCRYRMENEAVRCAEKPRVSVLENILRFYGDDIRSSAIILEPAREKGIGTLTYEYFDPKKDNATWIYLSALGKVKRIIANRDSTDSGSFFGSEFLIEDLDYPKLDDYKYTILRQEDARVTVDGKVLVRPAYVLERVPNSERARKTKYDRVVTWVDRERYILLKEQYYDRNGKLFKERTVKNLQSIQNHWWPKQVAMTNFTARRVSVIERESIVFDLNVPDEFLTQRTLTDQAFRERYLSQFRSAWK